MIIKTGDIFQVVSEDVQDIDECLEKGDLLYITEIGRATEIGCAMSNAKVHAYNTHSRRADTTPMEIIGDSGSGVLNKHRHIKSFWINNCEKIIEKCLENACIEYLGHMTEANDFASLSNSILHSVIQTLPHEEELIKLGWNVYRLQRTKKSWKFTESLPGLPKGFLPWKVVKPRIGVVMVHRVHGPVLLLDSVLDFISKYEETYSDINVTECVLQSGLFYDPCGQCGRYSKYCDIELESGKFCEKIIDPLPFIKRIEKVINGKNGKVRSTFKEKHNII